MKRLALSLVELRGSVGAPAHRRMVAVLRPCVKNVVSPNTLRNAELGERLPALPTLIQYITACRLIAEEDGVVVDPSLCESVQWQDRWRAARDWAERQESAGLNDQTPATPPHQPRTSSYSDASNSQQPRWSGHDQRSQASPNPSGAADYRRSQIDRFGRLLEDESYFQEEAAKLPSRGREAVWQHFFEENPWIFGIEGHNQRLASFRPENLMRMLDGCLGFGAGDRINEAVRASALVKSLVFVEVKTHVTNLLSGDPYRSGIWAPSRELTGGVVQVQGTADQSVSYIAERLQADVSRARPRSYLIIGDFRSFRDEDGGVHEGKRRSFELFRGKLVEPEVLTFDELLAQAAARVVEEIA
ncbi:Shedu immune nuclease family protein [Nocardia sp. CC201C]|uniref:Shedu immune nuclease family protein n=1 Tax=Nocardia sp. CC201C TaxID=3044575 RepID=UPI0024A84355|nr:Shedu immune nuclease family protein [Nocardia sp. CC201C]